MSPPARSRLTFPRFAALTTSLTLSLVMLGIYTAATGSGLACSAQWPLCDGGVLPQTVPSFIEWFHRLVAMVTGWFIVGTAIWAWRRPDRRVRASATLAVVLLPLQIGIGAVTVTLSGLLPAGYSAPTQGAHLVVALAIFAALVVTTLLARDPPDDEAPVERVRRALPVALAVLVVTVPFSRLVPAFAYTPAAQAAFYGTSLVLFATLLATTWWLGAASSGVSRARYATGAALAAVFATMLLGRDLVAYTPIVRLVNAALLLVAALLVLVATWAVYRRSQSARAWAVTRGD